MKSFSCRLPWVIADLKGQRNNGTKKAKDIILEVSPLAIKGVALPEGTTLFVHPLQNITKFSQTAQDKNYFTYLIRDHPDTPFTCHVFLANDEPTVRRDYFCSCLSMFSVIPVQCEL